MKFIGVLGIILLAAIAASPGPGAAEPAGRIAFLHLTMAGPSVTLDSVRVVPGTLKVPRIAGLSEGDLRVSVRSDGGELLSRLTVADPSTRRLEYVDEAGQLQTLVEVRDTVAFTVRVPYTTAVRTVEFSRVAAGETGSGAVGDREEPLGSVAIPVMEVAHD